MLPGLGDGRSCTNSSEQPVLDSANSAVKTADSEVPLRFFMLAGSNLRSPLDKPLNVLAVFATASCGRDRKGVQVQCVGL